MHSSNPQSTWKVKEGRGKLNEVSFKRSGIPGRYVYTPLLKGWGGKDVGWNNFWNKLILCELQAKGTLPSTEGFPPEWVYTSDTAIIIYIGIKQINKWVNR